MMDASQSAFSRISKAGGFPVALGGDRFITFPLVDGLAEGLGQNVGLIRISGQLSLADPDSSHGPHWTGASLRRILDEGHVQPKNTVCVGTQGYIPYREWDYARDQGVTVITADSLKDHGPEAAARRALDLAGDGCDAIYVSLDIGVVDSGYASGTADIVVGGVVPRDLLALMRALSASSKDRRPGRGRGRPGPRRPRPLRAPRRPVHHRANRPPSLRFLTPDPYDYAIRTSLHSGHYHLHGPAPRRP